MLQGYKDGTAGDNITEANVANEEDGVGDGYQDGEQMSRAKGTHQGGRVRVEKDVSAEPILGRYICVPIKCIPG